MFRQLAAIAAILMAGVPADAQHSAPSVVPLDMSGQRPIAMLAVGTQEPVPVIFDTGASGNVLDIEYARQIGLPNQGEAAIHAPAGAPMQGFRTTIAEGRLGNVSIGGARAAAIASPALQHLGVRGVFGPNSFSGRLVHLDLARGEIRVTDKNPATIPSGPSHPYSDGASGLPGLPAVGIEIGARRFDAHLDTGSPGLLMFPTEMASQLPLEAPMQLSDRPARFADGTPRNIYVARLRGTVRVGPLTFENPEIRFMDGLHRVNVGMQALRGLTIVIDPAERRSWLVRPGSSAGST
jgi:predicted aspartyl protease